MSRQPSDQKETAKTFNEAISKLATIGGFANSISMAQTGAPTTRAGELASLVFAKLCAHARSLGALSQSSMFDQSAILAMSRLMVEAATMHGYLRQGVAPQQWNLRYLLLRLHDTCARIKLLRAFPAAETLDLREGRGKIEAEIRAHPDFTMLPEQRQKKLLTGEEYFVGGMRRAAEEGMGWDGDHLNALYAYLSAHSHSTPMSFFRAREHAIDYYNPSEMQFAGATMAVEIAVGCLLRCALRQYR